MNELWQKMLSDPGHHFWKVIRLVVVGVMFLICASLLYNNSIAKADFMSLVLILLGLAGYDQAKASLTRE